jgi:hypothetical protein
LLLQKGLANDAEEVRDFSLKQIVSISKSAGKLQRTNQRISKTNKTTK